MDENWVIEVPYTGGALSHEGKRDEAYLAWAALPAKSTTGLQRLSQQLGVPVETLRKWRRWDGWEERWLAETQGARATLLQAAEAVLLTSLGPAVERLAQIATHGADKDAVAAMKLIAAIMGIDHPESRAVQINLISPHLLAEAKAISQGEMKRALTDLSQDHAAQNRRYRSD